jgi:hypothetical protein
MTSRQHQTQRTLLDWLRVEYGIERPGNKLLALAELDSNICLIALINDPHVVETILRHVGVWHDPPPRPPPHGLPGFSRVGRGGDFGGRTGNRK